MIACLIPARSGSKRIKNKNIKKFYGKPLIEYSIDLAKKSKIFKEIYVSTDSKKIANLAYKKKINVPFLRPKIISNDTANDLDVLEHFINYIKKEKIKINYLCYLYPTTPLLNKKILIECLNLIKIKKLDKVFTASEYNYPIQRSFTVINKKLIYKEKKYSKSRSQDLLKYFHDAGQCYWFNLSKIKNIRNEKNFNVGLIKLNYLDFYDLNTLDDFKILKKMYLIKNNLKK